MLVNTLRNSYRIRGSNVWIRVITFLTWEISFPIVISWIWFGIVSLSPCVWALSSLLFLKTCNSAYKTKRIPPGIVGGKGNELEMCTPLAAKINKIFRTIWWTYPQGWGEPRISGVFLLLVFILCEYVYDYKCVHHINTRACGDGI